MIPNPDASSVPGPGPRRRSLLAAALTAPAAAVAAQFGAAAPAAAANDTPVLAVGDDFDPQAQRFTVVVLPDTQYLFDEASLAPAPLARTFSYLLRHRQRENIAFVAHLGDVTEHGTVAEIAAVAETFDSGLGDRMPYSVLAGNHDVRPSTDDQCGPTPYLAAFGPQRYAGMPTFGGASPDGYNTYHRIRAGGRDWLILSLDWRASGAGLAWAQQVIDTHRTLPVILATHDLVTADSGRAVLSPNGRRLWDALIRRNDQIFLTLNGHYWPPGRAVLTNDAGHDVHAHLANYQDRYYGGAAMIRLYHVDLARNVIDVETFSPWFLARDPAERTPLEAQTLELTGDVDRFSVAIDFEQRFAGFAAVVPPPVRPPAAVLPRGTVAYWRFDAAGSAAGASASGAVVPVGTVVADLTGRGNDLTARLINSTDPALLTASSEHHRDQPAHASLRFDGGNGPARGAILEASPTAPINTMTFEAGFTIEVFFKLPDPFVGDHSWMGLLSWQGRSAEAGPRTGDPEEPTCSLNLSPERFLQFVHYPRSGDASYTAWSHAIPPGEWTHAAVVNDGRRTVVHVNGSRIVRNPTGIARGIATLGRPFVIGATQYGGLFDQGFYGWIGDVRICDRALPASRWLTRAEPS